MTQQYWTIVDANSQELLGIVDCDDGHPASEEATAVTAQLKRPFWKGWIWGVEITKAEFETYQAFGFKEIKLPC